MLRTRRALSSLITTVILLSATAMTGTGLVSWSNINLSSFETHLTNVYATNVNTLNENLVVENVWFGNTPSKFLTMTITNTGKIGLNVTDVKLTRSGTTLDIPSHHTALLSGQQNTTTITYAWLSKVPIQIQVTTSRGNIYNSQVMAP